MIAGSYHHTAVTVSHLERSVEFYETLGFSEVARYDRPETGKTMVHMRIGDVMLELWRYGDDVVLDSSEIDFEKELGLKHIALAVRSVERAYEVLQQQELATEGHQPSVSKSDPDIKYLFTRDPDGNWVEFIEDTRDIGTVGTQLAVKAVVENNGRFLILREGDSWQAPGGRIDGGEMLVDGVMREVLEETGISDLKIQGVVHVDEWVARPEGAKKHIVAVFFHCKTAVSDVVLQPMEHDEYRWIKPDDIAGFGDALKPEITQAIMKAVS